MAVMASPSPGISTSTHHHWQIYLFIFDSCSLMVFPTPSLWAQWQQWWWPSLSSSFFWRWQLPCTTSTPASTFFVFLGPVLFFKFSSCIFALHLIPASSNNFDDPLCQHSPTAAAVVSHTPVYQWQRLPIGRYTFLYLSFFFFNMVRWWLMTTIASPWPSFSLMTPLAPATSKAMTISPPLASRWRRVMSLAHAFTLEVGLPNFNAVSSY